MLKDLNGNGRCSAWAQLLEKCFENHNIPANIIKATPKEGKSLLVKHWKKASFIAPGKNGILDTIPRGDDKKVYIKYISAWKNGTLETTPVGDDIKLAADDLTNYIEALNYVDLIGVKGQGNEDPPRAFNLHYIIKCKEKIYDPSYGTGPFNNTKEHEEASIDGIGYSDNSIKLNTNEKELNYN